MRLTNSLVAGVLLVGLGACTALKTSKNRVVPDLRIDLKINSLHVKNLQEKGVLGTLDGDELSLLYALFAYDEAGNLIAINNGFWGTRTLQQNALILSDEFDRISVRIPTAGKVLAVLSLVEIDDYHGERKIIKIKPYTKSERHPKYLRITRYDEDQNLPPLELIANALSVAGYKHFVSRHLNLSINDDLGGTRKAYSAAELAKIANEVHSGKETFEIDGTAVNENYLYVLKYDLNVTSLAK